VARRAILAERETVGLHADVGEELRDLALALRPSVGAPAAHPELRTLRARPDRSVVGGAYRIIDLPQIFGVRRSIRVEVADLEGAGTHAVVDTHKAIADESDAAVLVRLEPERHRE